MSFKLTCGATEVVLRSPDYADVQRISLNDIRRNTRSGNYCVVSDDDHWRMQKSYVYKFSALTNVLHDPPADDDYLVDQLRDFLVDTAGLEIDIEDHLEVTRSGYILTPVNEIIAVRSLCSYDISFEFLDKDEILS